MPTLAKSLFSKFKTEDKNANDMFNDLHQDLWSSKAFQSALWGPVVIGLALIVITAEKAGMEPSLTVEGLKNFYEHFKLPSAIAGLSIPLSAIVASQIRSKQTIAAFKAQTEQNLFSNFIDHKNLFFDFYAKEQAFSRLKEQPTPEFIYRVMYGESARGNLITSSDFLKSATQIRDYCLSIESSIVRAKNDGSNAFTSLSMLVAFLDTIFDHELSGEIDLRESDRITMLVNALDEAAYLIGELGKLSRFYKGSQSSERLSYARKALLRANKQARKAQNFSISAQN